MEWKSDNDKRLAMFGDDPETMRAAADLAEMCGAWRDGTVWGYGCPDGRVAWLWRSTIDGSLLCMALAPRGSVWACEHVEGSEFFAMTSPPDGWVTKASAGLVRNGYGSAKAKRTAEWTGAEWCVGLWKVEGRPQARTVRLCRVASVISGKLATVVLDPDGPAVPIDRLGAARWIPQDAHPDGYAAIWASGSTVSGSYGVHVNRAKRATR